MDIKKNNQNNGLITKIWGPSAWIAEHAITFGYPINPSQEEKNNYQKHFENLGNVLPCIYCKQSYNKFLISGDTKLTKEVFKNRESLTKWFYKIHKAVNRKLGIEYNISYKELVNRYESYRASCKKDKNETKGCVNPANKNFSNYRLVDIRDTPIIPYNIIKLFEPYILEREFELQKDGMEFYNNSEEQIDKYINNKKDPAWITRNRLCEEIIISMRSNMIKCLEESGKYKGLPSYFELTLMLYYCSNLPKLKLLDVWSSHPYFEKYRANKIRIMK